MDHVDGTGTTLFQQVCKLDLEGIVAKRKSEPYIADRETSTWFKIRNPNTHRETPLADVNNLALKGFIATMAAERRPDGKLRFSAKSIHNYTQVIKMVVASAVNDEGEEIYPIKWNHTFIDLPLVKNQRTPTFNAKEISAIISEAKGQYALLYAVFAGTGLRAEEAFALQVEDIRGSVIHVRHSLWRGRLYSTKTDAGVREVDLPSALAEALANHIADRKMGFVFQTSKGTPLARSNVLRRSLHKILAKLGQEKRGFQAFRRYRVTHLRKQRVPEDLIRYWIGHAHEKVTDGYSKVKADVEFRAIVAEQAGLGFHIPVVAAGLPDAPIAPSLNQAEIDVSA